MGTIRSATKRDVPELQRLDSEAFPDIPMTSTYFYESIGFAAVDILVSEAPQDKLAGFISLFQNQRADSTLQIGSLAIDEKMRAQGLGGKLIEASIKLAIQEKFKVFELVVWPGNAKAISLYKNMGFEVKSTIENYYGDGNQRYQMQLDLEAG